MCTGAGAESVGAERRTHEPPSGQERHCRTPRQGNLSTAGQGEGRRRAKRR